MKERPIIFNAESVRAILARRKTMTRRVVKPQPTLPNFVVTGALWSWSNLTAAEIEKSYAGKFHVIPCPYAPGHRLWLRETWAAVWPAYDWVPLEECRIEYRADLAPGCTDYPGNWPAEEAQGDPDAPRWRASIHMPRWASRITLEVTGVQAGRVQDICEADAYAEGIDRAPTMPHPVVWYREHWDSLNAKRGFPWKMNPWVWVISFYPIKEVKQ